MSGLSKTFLGYGFGPIQSGLFLYEAYLSGNFRRFVVSEVDQALVDAIAQNGGRYNVNIARRDRIDLFALEGIELYNPRKAEDREKIIQAVAESDEMATALPSVNIYEAGGEASVVSLMAEGLNRREKSKPTILYAAENNNHAAEIFTEKLTSRSNAPNLTDFRSLNTVVGKMSGVITEPDVIRRLGLATITPDISRAILIEEFNRILISKVALKGYQRGIDVFEEKDDLLPFEEAKLYGHNAIHALTAYLAENKGLKTIADAGSDAEIMAIAREAFIEESGAAMIHRNGKTGDPLFTPEGYREYAEDLLERMTCPNLNDLVWRVGRDHIRKLGYNDRLFGTMRIVLAQGLMPTNLALGAAAGVLSIIRRQDEIDKKHLPANMPLQVNELTLEKLRALLLEIWGPNTDSHVEKLILMTWNAIQSF
jgi:mannitol-1-phosphate 5-dehydrogenase